MCGRKFFEKFSRKVCKNSLEKIKTVGKKEQGSGKYAQTYTKQARKHATQYTKYSINYANKQGRNYSKFNIKRSNEVGKNFRKGTHLGTRQQSKQVKQKMTRQKVSTESKEKLGERYKKLPKNQPKIYA